MALMNILEAINYSIDQQMEKDESIVVFGEDAGFVGGVFRVTAGLQKKYGMERVFDTPISEAAIIGAGVGMAAAGLKPIVEIQFSGFMLPAYNQIVAHAARLRNRSRSKYHVPMVIRMPYGGGVKALEHHSESLDVLFGHIPGLKLVVPSTPYDAKGLYASAIQDPDPVIIMEPKKIYRAFKQEVPEEEYFIPLGKAKVVKPGNDITVIAWGPFIRETEKAIKLLENDNISVELIDLRTIAPIDYETIVESVKKTGRLLVVHEAYKSFGPGAELITIVNEKAFVYLQAPPTRLTGVDVTVPLPKGEPYFMISDKRIAREIKKLMKFIP